MRIADLLKFRSASKKSRRATRRRTSPQSVPGAVENLEQRALLSAANGDCELIEGTDTTDEIRVTRIDETMALVQISSFDSRNFTNQNSNLEFEIDYRNGVEIDAAGANDRIVIDSALATNFTIDGGLDPEDELIVFGDGVGDAKYIPSGSDSAAGVFTVGDFELEFDATELLVVTSFDSLDITTPEGSDVIFVDEAANGRTQLYGTSMTQEIATLQFESIQSVSLDLGANDTDDSQHDWFETRGTGLTDSGADVFTVYGGAGNDRFVIRPSVQTEIAVNGGSPFELDDDGNGDQLTVELAGVRNSRLPTTVSDGRVTSSSHADIIFDGLEEVRSTAVTVLSPTGTISGESTTFTWTANPNAEAYELWVGNLELQRRVISETNLTTTTFTTDDIQLELGRHRAWVRPIVDGEPSAWSRPIDFLVSQKPVAFLNAINETDMTPTFVWDSAEGARRFEVWVSNSTANTSTIYRVDGDLDRFTIPDEDALPIGNYRYSVRAFDARNNATEWSSIRSFRIITPPQIEAPTRPSIEARTTFEWSEVLGASRYELFVNRVNPDGTETREFVVDDITSTSYQVSESLDPGVYRFWVRAWNGTAARSFWSNPQTFETGTDIVPQIEGPEQTVNVLRPTITWTDLHGVGRYEVWIAESNGDSPFIQQDRIFTNSFTPDEALEPGRYFVWVRAISNRGAISDWSDPFLFETQGGVPTVTGPIGQTNDFLPRVTWTEIEDATSYRLIIRQVQGGSVNIDVSDITATGFTPTAPLNNGTYRVWVRAINAAGENSPWSEPRSFTIV